VGLQNILHIEPGSVIWTIATFLVIVWLIGKFGWKPILTGLKSREDGIRKDLETAKSEREKAAALLADYQSTITGAKKEAAEILQKAQESASAMVDEARVKSREESQRERERAQAEIERTTEASKTELRKYVTELTARATTKLLGRTIDAKEHERLILDALKEDK
jgi:F-type H+-transporting ATPase subunit b